MTNTEPTTCECVNVALQQSNMAWTPQSQEELFEYIDRFGGHEKALATLIMLITWNLCAQLTNPELTNDTTQN
jgi:hypothetical protein